VVPLALSFGLAPAVPRCPAARGALPRLDRSTVAPRCGAAAGRPPKQPTIPVSAGAHVSQPAPRVFTKSAKVVIFSIALLATVVAAVVLL
jgi:hypothetical protein